MKQATAAALPAMPEGSVSRLGYLIYRVERLVRARLDEGLRALGASTPEYVTLSVLRNHDGLSCAQLARWGCVTPQAMNLVIASLERQGLVRRSPDPADRRSLRTSVTPGGLELLERCDTVMDEIEREMLLDVDGETLRAALDDCAHSLDGSRPLPRSTPVALRDASPS